MDIDLEFCLKRFADEQVTDGIKQIAQLERNLERKRRNIAETSHCDDEAICQRENTLVKQFSRDLNENNILINKTRQIIEDEFGKALHDIKADIEIIAQIPATRNNHGENNEEIRAGSSKIRQQIARIDSELTHLFNIIDSNNFIDYSSRIRQRLQQHYGYANELNRLVGKNSDADGLLVFSQRSLLIQSISERVHLWHSRQTLITKFAQLVDDDFTTSEYLMNFLYRMTDTSSSLNFIQGFIQNQQEQRRHREIHLIHKMEQELEQQRIEQQTRVIELVNALCQLCVNTASEYQLNKKLMKVLRQTDTSKQLLPVLIDRRKAAIMENPVLIIRFEANYKKWAPNEDSIQERFCLALCENMHLPIDALRIECVEQDSVMLYIRPHPPHDPFIIKLISDRERDIESSISLIQTIQNCCTKFDSRLRSIVSGQYTLPIEKRLMHMQWDKIYINNCGAISDTCTIDLFDRNDTQSLCPKGWKRFCVKVADNDADFDARWGSWHVAYHGSRGLYAPFILTSGLRVVTQRHCLSGNQQAIYLSPSIEYSAHPRHTTAWKKTTNDGDKCQYYQLVFQCRVNPTAVGDLKPETLLHQTHKTICIDQDFPNDQLEWIIHADAATQEHVRDNIVCYALMIRVIDSELRDLPTLSWWKYSHSAEY